MITAAGCSGNRPAGSRVYKMGEQARAGPLSYTAVDTEWFDQLGEGPNAKMPQHRFLAIRLSVSNSASLTSAIPGLMLMDARGDTYAEVTDGQALREWLGYLRNVGPNQTVHGRVLFDVPTANYRLCVSSDADPEEQATAFVEIPYQLPAEVPAERPDR